MHTSTVLTTALLLLAAPLPASAAVTEVGVSALDRFFDEVRAIDASVTEAERHLIEARRALEDAELPAEVLEALGRAVAEIAELATRIKPLIAAAIALPADFTLEQAALELPPWRYPRAVRSLTTNIIETCRLPSRVAAVIDEGAQLLRDAGAEPADYVKASLAAVELDGLIGALRPDGEATSAWRVELGGVRPHWVHISDSGVVVGVSNESMTAVYGETGEPLWQLPSDSPSRSTVGETAGVPALVYSTCVEPKKASCRWVARELLTGALRWELPMSAGALTLVPGHTTALVSPWSEDDPRPLRGLDVTTGELTWSDETLRLPPVAPLEAQTMDPALTGLASSAVLQCEDTALGLRQVREGTLTWRWSSDTALRCETAQAMADVVVVMDDQGRLHAVGAADGAHRWQTAPLRPASELPPIVAWRDLLLLSDNQPGSTVYALQRSDGVARWTAALPYAATPLMVADSPATFGGWSVHTLDPLSGAPSHLELDLEKDVPVDEHIVAGDRLVLRGGPHIATVDVRQRAVVYTVETIAEEPKDWVDRIQGPSARLGTAIGKRIAEGYANPTSPGARSDYLFQRTFLEVGSYWLAGVACVQRESGSVKGVVNVTGVLWPYEIDPLGESVYAFQQKKPGWGGPVMLVRQACGVP